MKNGILALSTFLLPVLSFAQNEMGLDQKIDRAFKPFSDFISSVIFFEVFEGAPFVIYFWYAALYFSHFTLASRISGFLAKQ
tara:strand:- start:3396 stop:3641 length:246 start_codon:yes stop_codon:yes gene_type:complete